jgi:hypothetical protein
MRSGVGAARSPPLGWQPSRFLADCVEAERAFQLAERLGSVNAAAQELRTTWPSLRKALQRHGLGMPARNPETVCQRAIDGAHKRGGQLATPSLDPGLWRSTTASSPSEPGPTGELAERVRRAEDYATLGAGWWLSVELHSESHAAKPTTRAWAITRRADRAHRRRLDREQRGERRQADRTSRSDPPQQAQEREMVANAR